MRRSRLLALAGLLPAGAPAIADQISLAPSKDATIYYDLAGATANGAGDYLFAGNNGNTEPRRTLIRFDLSGIPAGSTIQQVTLNLTMSRAAGNDGSLRSVSLSRLTKDWSEGRSDAPDEEGAGTAALPGDSTWLHTYYNTAFWNTPGGDFVVATSASLPISETNPQACTFGPSAGLVSDVQGWVNDPSSNFGWIMLGDESTFATARRFNSRTNPDASTRPSLEVTYAPPAPACYPNCDHSTTPPTLNVADFTCFLQKFAAQDPYANCDNSTTAPALNVADFTCFLQKFAAGCSAP
jgi:hypothetical protein